MPEIKIQRLQHRIPHDDPYFGPLVAMELATGRTEMTNANMQPHNPRFLMRHVIDHLERASQLCRIEPKHVPSFTLLQAPETLILEYVIFRLLPGKQNQQKKVTIVSLCAETCRTKDNEHPAFEVPERPVALVGAATSVRGFSVSSIPFEGTTVFKESLYKSLDESGTLSRDVNPTLNMEKDPPYLMRPISRVGGMGLFTDLIDNTGKVVEECAPFQTPPFYGPDIYHTVELLSPLYSTWAKPTGEDFMYDSFFDRPIFSAAIMEVPDWFVENIWGRWLVVETVLGT